MCPEESGESSWRVTATGRDSAVRDSADASWGRSEAVAAHRWVEQAAPESGFAVTRRGAPGRRDEVEAAVTVQAPDVAAAEDMARSMLGQALPSVTFGSVLAEPLTAAHIATYRAQPTTPRAAG
ncbi:MAG TPA: hypothetical protein VGL44_05410 [Gaiellales bacterium]|jgi:hypothetical protein